MARAERDHPDLATLHRLADGDIGPSAMIPLARHLEECGRCRAARDRIATLNQDLSRLPSAEEPEEFTSRVMARIATLPAPRRRSRKLRLVLPAGLGVASVLAYLLLPSGSRMLQGVSRIVTFDLLEPARLLEFLVGVATAVFGGVGRAVDGLVRPVPFFPSLAGAEASMVLMMMAAAVLVIAVSSMVAVALAGRGLLRARSRRA